MPHGGMLAAQGAIASSGGGGVGGDPGVSSWSTTAPAAGSALPSDVTSILLRAGSGAVVVSGAAARYVEGNCSAVAGNYYSAARGPKIASGPYWVKTGNGGAAVSTDRGFGPGYSNVDGTIAVALVSFQTTSQIFTFISGTATTRASGSSAASASGSDVMELRYAFSGADVVYTAWKNGSATALTWTDTGAAIAGTPGRYPIGVLRRVYNFGQFASPGIDTIEAGMI